MAGTNNFRNVPHSPGEELYKTCFRDLDAIHPEHQRPYRDIHNIWQWGIVDADLIGRMNRKTAVETVPHEPSCLATSVCRIGSCHPMGELRSS